METNQQIYLSLNKLIASIERRIRRDEDGPISDLTFSEVSVLLHLCQNGSTNMKDLADALHVSSSTPTRIVDALVEKGIVRREHAKEDRRMVVVELAEKGTAIVQLLMQKYEYEIDRIIGVLTEEEKEQMLRIVQKVSDTL